MKTIAEVLAENPGVTEFVDAKGNVWKYNGNEFQTTYTIFSPPNQFESIALVGLRPLRKKRVEIEGVVHAEYLHCENIVFKTNEKPHNKHIAAKLIYEIPDDEPEPKKEGREMWFCKRSNDLKFLIFHEKPLSPFEEVIHVREVVE